jgi:thiol-disulfide isomerase/thioredoxin
MSIFGVHHHSSLRAAGHLPSFDGATEWLNSAPLSPADLRGQVVLVDFWTLTCINWLRTQPHIRAWSQAYRDDGLVVVGVHTPEFSFEHEIEHVQQAVQQRAIDYPVALDNDYAVWSAFDNQYWPALYFVDKDGIIRDHHFGEGRYEQSERVIQQLLGIERDFVSVKAVGVEAEADWDNLRSPETYLGYARGGHKAPVEHLRLNQWGLAGEWTSDPRKSRLNRRTAASPSASTRATRISSSLATRVTPSRSVSYSTATHRAVCTASTSTNRAMAPWTTAACTSSCGIVSPSATALWRFTFFEGGAEAYVFTFG